MKKWISLVVVTIGLLTFAACEKKADKTPSAISAEQQASNSYMANVYYEYLTSLGEIETEGSDTAGVGVVRHNVYDLYYYTADFNDDGIIDLAISAEKSDGNGIKIYTYKDGQVEKLLSKRMPYSAGSEIFTLATYEDAYGIQYLRMNSTGEFSFFRIDKDGTLEAILEGESYDLNGNALDGHAAYDKINAIVFLSIEELTDKS